MKTLLSFILLLPLVLSSTASRGAEVEPEYALSARGEIVLEADGTVRSYTLDGGLAPQVSDLVSRNVATWRFEPILVDGEPVVARTRMSLSILASPDHEGNYVLRVADAWFGDLKARSAQSPPRYPRNAIKAGIGARVLLVLKLDAEGNVVDAHPYQTSLSQRGSEARARRWRAQFEKASIDAAMRWKYEPGEIVGGKTVGTTLMVPFEYTIVQGMKSAELTNHWRAYAPGPITPAPWVDASSLASIDTDGLADGTAAAVDSRFRLVSDVIGKAL